MDIILTDIPEVKILKPKIFEDSRGCFFESYNSRDFNLATHKDVTFVQDNQSKSCYGVLRGLHFQKGDKAQAKLVRVLSGRVLDIAVDIRQGSPNFGKYVSIELSSDNKLQLWIPRGFAHGFVVLSEQAEFAYKCDNYYSPADEGAIVWNDPQIAIDWRIPTEDIILSPKDAAAPLLCDANDLPIYQG